MRFLYLFIFINLASLPLASANDCFDFLKPFVRDLKNNQGEFSTHYSNWLKKNGFHEILEYKSHWNSFGGFNKDSQKVKGTPTIFIHGNSDSALGSRTTQPNETNLFTGWSHVTESLNKKGIHKGLMYGLTVGDADPKLAHLQIHNAESLIRLRQLIIAVSEYSKQHGNTKGQVNIVAHSMGNSLALKAILGGDAFDIDSQASPFYQNYVPSFLKKSIETSPMDPGGDLTHLISHYIGISSATKGLDSCKGFHSLFLPTCHDLYGLRPTSLILKEINAFRKKFAHKITSIFSRADSILGTSNDLDRSEGISSIIPQSDNVEIFDELDHFDVKDENSDLIFKLLYQ